MDTAIQVLRRAYERGITFYDTANAYRDSEDKIGRAFEGMRGKIIIATKTMQRTLKTRHNLPMAVKLVKTGLFSTIQFPFNFIEDAAKNELFHAAREFGMGIITMKPFAGGMIDNAEVAIKYLRQYPDAVPIPGYDSVDSVDQVTSYYQCPNVLTDNDRELMEKYRRDLGKQFCRRCEYCQPCPNGVMITMAMAYKLVASRMSPAVSVVFSRPAMESVKLCSECEICIERCPYELPIPEMLKANYELYEHHIALSK